MNISGYLEKKFNIKISDNIVKIINEEARFRTFQNKHIVILEGMKSTNLYFIIRGLVRGYYIDNKGNDITKCFSCENEFFSSEGLRSLKSSTFTIECLEQCECIELPYKLIMRIMDEDKELKNIFIEYYLNEVERLEKRIKNRELMNAEERYREFICEYPDLYNRVELKYIASYIGIRPASLSRIRKKN